MISVRTCILLLVGCVAHVKHTSAYNITHPMYVAYSKLRQDILARNVSINKIPPCLETGFQERYSLDLRNYIVNIHNFDEIRQIMTLQIFFIIRWHHKGLLWNPLDYDNISSVWIDSSILWTPTLFVNMGAEGSPSIHFDLDLMVTSDGYVTFTKLGFLSFSCSINFKHFPFDSQYCSFGLFPLGPPYAEPTFLINSFSLSQMFVMTKDWLLENIDQHIVTVNDTDSNVQTKIPTYGLTVWRQHIYYVVSILFPMVLTSIMIPFVFAIPPQTGEKVSYLIALFTSTAIYLNYISDVMPRCLQNMPYLAVLLIEVLVEGLCALLASLLVVNVYIKEKAETYKNRTFVYSTERTYSQKQNTKESSRLANVKINCNLCMFTSKRLDKIFLVIFTIGQTIFILSLFLGTDWVKSGHPIHV